MDVPGTIGMPWGADRDELVKSKIQAIHYLIHRRSILVKIKFHKPEEIIPVEQGSCGGVEVRQ